MGHSVCWPAGVRANQSDAHDEHIVWPHPTMRTSTLASMQMLHSASSASTGRGGDRGGVTTDGARTSDSDSGGGGGGCQPPRSRALSAATAVRILRRLPREMESSLRSPSWRSQKTESSISSAASVA